MIESSKNFENSKNDPILFGTLVNELQLLMNKTVMIKTFSNSINNPNSLEVQKSYLVIQSLEELILKNTKAGFFGNAQDDSIIAYGCNRIDIANILPILPTISLN